MSIAESLKTYMRGFSGVDQTKAFRVDNITNELSYAVTIVPSVRTLTEDIVGNKIQQRQFLFLVRAATARAQDYIANQGFLENLEAWLDSNNHNKIYPDVSGISPPIEPMEIQAVNAAYLSEQEDSEATAVYQITCNFIYKKGAQ